MMALSKTTTLKNDTLERIRKLFCCIMCSSPFKDPVAVRCGHIFCGQCFKTLMKRKSPSCPSCKLSVTRDHAVKRDDCAQSLKKFDELTTSYQKTESRSSRSQTGSGSNSNMENRREEAKVEDDLDDVEQTQPIKKLKTMKTVTVENKSQSPQISKRKRRKEDSGCEGSQSSKLTSNPEAPEMEAVITAAHSSSFRRETVVSCDQALDLSMKLPKSENVQKKPRFAFQNVYPSLALDLSLKRHGEPVKASGPMNIRPPVKKMHQMESSKRHLYFIDTLNASHASVNNVDLTVAEVSVPLSLPQTVPKPLPRVEACSKGTEDSENSDRILSKAMDALLSAEEHRIQKENAESRSNNNLEILSDDDEDLFLNVMMDPAEDETNAKDTKKRPMESSLESSSPGTKKIKMKDDTEVELLSSSPAKSPDAAPVVITNANNDAGDDSDSGASDVLFQTPKSQQRSPRTRTRAQSRSASKPKNMTPSKSSPLRAVPALNFPACSGTPKDLPLLCISPPSGAVVAQALDCSSAENFDPFANGLDEISVHKAQEGNQNVLNNGDTDESEYPKTPDKQSISSFRGSAQKSLEKVGFETPKSRSSKQFAAYPIRTPPSQRKIFGTSSPGVSPSKGPKKFVFCPTRLSSLEHTKLRQLCGMFGGKISREYTEEVSHLILTLENGQVPQTMKYLFAIAGKKWVVTFDWVAECLRQKKIVREDPFETSNFPGCDIGVKKSRLADIPLFKGYQFYVLGNLESSGASVDDWGKLLKKLGARVITNEDQVRKNVIIVGDSLDRTENYQRWYQNQGTITVAWEWILDCVLSYSKIPIKTHYIITRLTQEQVNNLQLPKEILP